MTSIAPNRSDVVALAPRNDGEAIVCFSHLRWAFVFQRPQHLMTRFARTRSVIVFEEPVSGDLGVDLSTCDSGVVVVTPRLPDALPQDQRPDALALLLRQVLDERRVSRPVMWFYTPMMLPLIEGLDRAAVAYDCMDELSAFKFAPPELLERETELLAQADVVFTGGYSLYQAKADRHDDIHPFPSSVDREHFATARSQARLQRPRPTIGYFGVIDERIDLSLIARIADARPDWRIELVGPVAKIADADLPRRANIAWLGQRDYADLPGEIGRWDVALMPFALNESTRFISPTKTPEYLAAGRPVVSTAVRDVVRHYGDLEGVQIASGVDEFVSAIEASLALTDDGPWLAAVDEVLATLSWDQTHLRMAARLQNAMDRKRRGSAPAPAIRPSGLRSHYDVLVVGAGFAGSVMAERLASDGKSVLVVDRRPHVGGNAFDRLDDAGVLIHQYGPHIFHTNSADVFDYLSRFTGWRPYEHRVLASVDGKLVPVPINRTTLNMLYGLNLRSDEQAADYLASRAEPTDVIRTSEDVVVSAVGRELYEKFFRGYTRKQWGLDPSELDKSVTARVPTRTNTDDRYFTDTFQAMPIDGYTRMFETMLSHANITVATGVDYRDVRDEVRHDHLVFTGPIDEYFDHRYGALPYRSLRFEHRTLDRGWSQPVATVNYPDEATPYTRITEFKHLTGQAHPRTSVTYEYPMAEGDPYYPVPRPENQALFKQYEALARAEGNVSFVGRLATYRYYNMDQVTGQALATARRMTTTDQESAPGPVVRP